MAQTYYQDPARYRQAQQSRQDQMFRDTLNMMVMGKQMQMQRGQQEWKQLQAEKEFKLEQGKLESLTAHRKAQQKYWEYQQGKPVEFSEREKELLRVYQALGNDDKKFNEWFLGSKGVKRPKPIPKKVHPDKERYFMKHFGGDWRNQITSDQYKEQSDIWEKEFTRPRPQTSPEETRQNKILGRDLKFVEKVIKRYEGRIEFLSEDVTIGMDVAGTSAIENLQQILPHLLRMQNKVSNGLPLSTEEWKFIRRLNINVGRIEKGESQAGKEGLKFSEPAQEKIPTIEGKSISADKIPQGTQVAVNPQTGERLAWINGKWVKIK